MMVQRGLIDAGKFRISRPGKDVSSTNPSDFMMHENFLFSQPYFFRFVACPFAGDTSQSSRNEIVDVAVPDVTDDPVVIMYTVTASGSIVWPSPRSFGVGNPQSGYPTDRAAALFKFYPPTTLRIRFVKGDLDRTSPQGAYIVLLRRADA